MIRKHLMELFKIWSKLIPIIQFMFNMLSRIFSKIPFYFYQLTACNKYLVHVCENTPFEIFDTTIVNAHKMHTVIAPYSKLKNV